MIIPTTECCSVTTMCSSPADVLQKLAQLSFETAAMDPKLTEIVEGGHMLGGRSVLAWHCLPLESPNSSSMESWTGAEIPCSPSDVQFSNSQKHNKGTAVPKEAPSFSNAESSLDVRQIGSSLLDLQFKIPERLKGGESPGHLNEDEVPVVRISAPSEEPPSSRVKLMCSFGGKILPRPSDGYLRYVGGETRMVAVNRDIHYAQLMLKMAELYGHALTLKYQLPGEDLDALVSVSSDEDLENMMEEYDRLEAGDGTSRLRVFLFSASESEFVHLGDSLGDFRNSEQRYVDAVNGILETFMEHSEIGTPGGVARGVEDLTGLDTADTCGYFRVEDSLSVSMLAQVSHQVITQLQIPVSLPLTSLQCISNPPSAPPTAPPSPSFLSGPSQLTQPSVLDLSNQYFQEQVAKVNVHPYPNFAADLRYQELELSTSSPLPSAIVPEYHFEARRTADSFMPLQRELHLSGFHQDNAFRGDQQHLGETIISRVGSQGKVARMQEHFLELAPNIRADNRTVVEQFPDMLYQKEYQRLNTQLQRAELRSCTDALMPRVSSYGKLSRLQEQYADTRPSSFLIDNASEAQHLQDVSSSKIEQKRICLQQQSLLQQHCGILQEKAVREQRHLSESLAPRIGSHGKLAHMHDLQVDNCSPPILLENRPDGQHVKLSQVDLHRLVLQSQQQQLHQAPVIYQENAVQTEQWQLRDSVLSAGSHGKLTRLQEQQFLDPHSPTILVESISTSQQMPEVMLPQTDFQHAVMQHQLPAWQHITDPQHDNHKGPERLPQSFDHGHSHQQAVQQHSLVHHLHYRPHLAAIHDASNRQLEQPHHQDDAFSSQSTHRTESSQDVSNHTFNGMASAFVVHARPDPSSPHLSYRDVSQRQMAPMLQVHHPYDGPLLVDQQYGRKPHAYNHSNQAGCLSRSPPRYNDTDERALWHHQQQFIGNPEASSQDQAPNFQLHYDGAVASQIQYSEHLARSGVPYYVDPFQEGILSYQDNFDAMEIKRQTAHGKDTGKVLMGGQQYYQFPPLNSRVEYQDQLSPYVDQISIHGGYHERQEKATDWTSNHRVCERDDSQLNIIERAWKGQTTFREAELKFDVGVNRCRESKHIIYPASLSEDLGSTHAFEDPVMAMRKRTDWNEISGGSSLLSNPVMHHHAGMVVHSAGTGTSITVDATKKSTLYGEISNEAEHLHLSTVLRAGESLQEIEIVTTSSEQNCSQHLIFAAESLPSSGAQLSDESFEGVHVDQLTSESCCLPSTTEMINKDVIPSETTWELPPTGGAADRVKVDLAERSQCHVRDSGESFMDDVPGIPIKDDLGSFISSKSSNILLAQGNASVAKPALRGLAVVPPTENSTLFDGSVSTSPCSTRNMNEDESPPGIAVQFKSTTQNSQAAISITPMAKNSISGTLISTTLDVEDACLSESSPINQHEHIQRASFKSMLRPECIDVGGAGVDSGYVFPLGSGSRTLSSIQMSATKDLAEDMVSSILGSQEASDKDIAGQVEEEICGDKEALSAAGQKLVMIPSFPKQEQKNAQTIDADNSLIEEPVGHLAQIGAGTTAETLSTKKVAFQRSPDDVKSSYGCATSVAETEATARGLQTIKNADLEEIKELGSGTFGTVYHGKWRGSDVAIKRIKASCFAGQPSERERLIADFWKEACTLSHLHHPNVVAFYGVVPDGPGGTLATVTEYMVNGSLKQVLQKKDRTIDRRKRLLIAMDAAFGMEYLHGKNIVHFDLKCENLLVNMRDPHRPICKVGDLGLSKVKQQTMVSGGVRGTLPWMAPELLNGNSSMVTEKVDIFSFGIVMWELLTGEEPYANMHHGEIIGGIVNDNLRPPIPNWCDPAWKSLMERCWAADYANRPSFSEVVNELRTMTTSIQSKTQG
ncbi:hypothetical protein O6H91_16G000700 [Diphasiastrum complanatum]|uniref:Uncharacterized protein n=1 Tax=Diphasiastrum complanatum TaxID=34168 RepID=A0ACC2B951_DIPCM|nr:hypothetical protein O6H91_16G000700 [Diphasiastrum complanatum]